MRLRYVKGAADTIAQHPKWIYNDPGDHNKQLNELFPKDQPLHLEIGMGKGQFLYTHAAKHPYINYLGLEKFDSAIVKALYKQIEQPRDNYRLVRGEAEHLLELLPPHSVERIYLNFSDPWPKARHEKRRLTNPRFLTMYHKLLVPGGEIHFKTDNQELFDYSVEIIQSQPMNIVSMTRDLHRDQTNIITTEFEDRFLELGQPIYHLIATFKEEHHG